MKFSGLIKQSNSISKFSPNGQFLANTINNRIIIRNVENLQIEETFVCVDVIEGVEWASDSKYILCAMYKRRVVQAFSLEDAEWHCRIDEGSLGILDAQWSPDGRHILTTAKYHLRITIWSLLNRSVSYLKYAKAVNPGLAYSPDGKYVALAERRGCKDHICILLCSNWKIVKNFYTETKDLGGILWSPANDILCIWDAIPENYNVCLYSLDGHCLATYCAYQWALGVKTAAWSPTSQFLAVGSYDEKVRLLNHITWQPIAEYSHPSVVTSEDVVVYQEIEINSLGTDDETNFPGESFFKANLTYEIFNNRPLVLNALAVDNSKANPKIGVGTIAFSSNARYIATINDNMPNVVWIWDIDKLEMANVLIQKHTVKHLAWSPSKPVLALCTGSSQIYLWNVDKCITQEIPNEGHFQIHKLLWHPRGESLLLMSKENLCLAIC